MSSADSDINPETQAHFFAPCQFPEALLARIGQFLEADLSKVSFYETNLATTLETRSFASGERVFCAPGEFKPADSEGLRLLIHELVHVLQQRNGRVPKSAGSAVVCVLDPDLELEADQIAAEFIGDQAPERPDSNFAQIGFVDISALGLAGFEPDGWQVIQP